MVVKYFTSVFKLTKQNTEFHFIITSPVTLTLMFLLMLVLNLLFLI